VGSKLKNVTMAEAMGKSRAEAMAKQRVAAMGTTKEVAMVKPKAAAMAREAVAKAVVRAAARGVDSGSKASRPGNRCTQRLLPVRGCSPTRCSSRSLGRIRSPSEASGPCTNLVGLVL
jgi:hypothetical protein